MKSGTLIYYNKKQIIYWLRNNWELLLIFIIHLRILFLYHALIYTRMYFSQIIFIFFVMVVNTTVFWIFNTHISTIFFLSRFLIKCCFTYMCMHICTYVWLCAYMCIYMYVCMCTFNVSNFKAIEKSFAS